MALGPERDSISLTLRSPHGGPQRLRLQSGSRPQSGGGSHPDDTPAVLTGAPETSSAQKRSAFRWARRRSPRRTSLEGCAAPRSRPGTSSVLSVGSLSTPVLMPPFPLWPRRVAWRLLDAVCRRGRPGAPRSRGRRAAWSRRCVVRRTRSSLTEQDYRRP